MSRYIRAIYAPLVGVRVSNQELLDAIALRFKALEVGDAEKNALFDFVRLLLIGHRTRYTQYSERFLWMDSFTDHAVAFARAIGESTNAIAGLIEEAPPEKPFDAVFGVSSEGLLLPGIAERAARRLVDRTSGREPTALPGALEVEHAPGGRACDLLAALLDQ